MFALQSKYDQHVANTKSRNDDCWVLISATLELFTFHIQLVADIYPNAFGF